MFSIYYHDHYEHSTCLFTFDNLVDAQRELDDCCKQPVEPYDYGYELVNEADPMEWEVLDFRVVQEEPTD
jgi:hypothetical protein